MARRDNDIACEKRRKRQDYTAFKSLVATPGTGALTFPANAYVYLKSRAGCAAGTTAATSVGPTNRTFKTPLLAAGAHFLIGRIERATVLTPVAGFDILIDDGIGHQVKVGGA